MITKSEKKERIDRIKKSLNCMGYLKSDFLCTLTPFESESVNLLIDLKIFCVERGWDFDRLVRYAMHCYESKKKGKK